MADPKTKLACFVDVYDDHGVAHSFGPDDDVPAWVRAKITRKDLWEPAEGADQTASTPSEPEESTEVGTSDGEPPRAGKGSGRDAWAEHATELGVDVTDDMSRDDIIEAVEAQ